ncbi:MAG: type IX secretion system membrane protein PorP/SprF, partial [Bacteroidetes bacterium]|nr:type IX secretion system membrane protein PorP/SprF [Bacteroidota bacterium]
SFEDRFFLSLGLRPMSAILISSGFRLFISIDLLLAYELNITAMHNYSNGTYGVLLRYNF